MTSPKPLELMNRPEPVSLEAKIEYNLNMDKDLSTMVRQFLEHLEVERNCSRLTVRNYEHYLNRLIDFLESSGLKPAKVSDINADKVRSFRLFLARSPGTLGNEMKPVTQGYYVIALRAFLKWLIKNDIVAMQPEKLDVPKGKDHSLKCLNQSEVDRLLSQPIMSTKNGMRDKAMLEPLFSSGLRVSELVSLNREKIDLKNREFSIVGKGGRARVVFISKRAAEFLGRYLRERTDKYKPLFIRYGGKKDITDDDDKVRLTVRSVQRLVKDYVRKAKITKDATPHTLRHSMATDMLMAGADIRSVQEILGHKNIATTQIYTHVTDARLREIHEKFHRGNK